ncbi:putative lipid II flippase FtsW [Acidobacteriota bacterium]
MGRDSEVFKPFGFDRILFFTTLILVSIGIVMVFSSSGILSSEKFGHPFHYILHQLIGAGLGISIILIMFKVNTPFYSNRILVYGLLFLTIGLLFLCLIMPSYGSTDRWIQVFNLRFQPSELAKISLILFLAYFLDKKKEKINHPLNLAAPLIAIFIILVLILMEPDYSTAIIVFLLSSIMLFLGGVKLRYFIVPGIISAGLFSFYLIQAPYRLQRITAFLSPEKDPLGSGFHIIQSKLAVGSGGIFRLNIGESIQKLFFLPAAHTDYIYAIVGEELGFLGALTVIFLFAIFLWRGLLISRRAPNLFSQVAAAGITLAIFIQAMVNISVVLGMGPPTGLPLPMISYGRSSLITTLFAVGILLHISQRRKAR